ncbi:hypothetical protein ACFLY3_04195 [Chloroflexota bacterium]
MKRVEISMAADTYAPLPKVESQMKTKIKEAQVLKGYQVYEDAIKILMECLKMATLIDEKISLYIDVGVCYICICRELSLYFRGIDNAHIEE